MKKAKVIILLLFIHYLIIILLQKLIIKLNYYWMDGWIYIFQNTLLQFSVPQYSSEIIRTPKQHILCTKSAIFE